MKKVMKKVMKKRQISFINNKMILNFKKIPFNNKICNLFF